MNQVSLKKHIAKIPLNPGVYMFSSKSGKILYIGKASNLKSRLKSYLPRRQAGLKIENPRIQKMINSAQSLKFLQTESDIEALILESQLIKKFRPQFNIVMRDDKQYAFVGFTVEKYPRIFITHQPTVPNFKFKILNSKLNSALAEFVGPFTDIGALKITLRYLRRVFPYCTCKQLHHNYCLNYHIGKCMGVCCLKIKNENIKNQNDNVELKNYKKNIRAIQDILSGKKSSLIKNLEKEMTQSAKRGNLEKAIELKEKIERLKRVFENAKIIQKSSHTHISICGYDNKNNKKTKNSLVKILGLLKMPVRIEGYDISNIRGAHATGSMITFINGQPDKSFYRKFKIRRILPASGGLGDVQMLSQILERRFKHHEWPFPDLIVIDGGKGQVNAAGAAISKSEFLISKQIQNPKFQIPIIGISKNKRHVGHQLIIPSRKTPLSLTKLSPTDKNLLLAIASEAHRFAIGYYRKLHRKYLK